MLWRTIKGIDGKSKQTEENEGTIKGMDAISKQTAENEGITFTGRLHTSPRVMANSFNRQFTTSKLGKHSSSRRTRQVSNDKERMSLEETESIHEGECIIMILWRCTGRGCICNYYVHLFLQYVLGTILMSIQFPGFFQKGKYINH